MSLAEIRQRIEKGCDKYIVDIVSQGKRIMIQCGQIDLCPECKAQLKLLDEIEGEMKKELDEFDFDEHISLELDKRGRFNGGAVFTDSGLELLKQKLLGVGI